MMKRRTFIKGALALPLLGWAAASCEHMGTVTDIAVAVGGMDEATANALNAVAKTFEDITPRQEYFIGRAVGANILTKYSELQAPELTIYVNRLGHTLAQFSERPQTFGGYHFLLLDSDELNAFAAPDGLIFVTRGLLECCETEDALAGVLAHEIGHVAKRHGLQAIETSRLTDAVVSSANALAPGELEQLTQVFNASIDDITKTLITDGYSRDSEREADLSAVRTCLNVGYSAQGMVQALGTMKERLKPDGHDFAKTHPSPADRIADVEKASKDSAKLDKKSPRQKRFKKALKTV